MKATIHEVQLTNRVSIKLIFNLEKETWIIINNGTGGSFGGRLDQLGGSQKERTHHHFWIASGDYEMVINPTEDGQEWETFSFFDVKKQNYIDNANGNIKELHHEKD